MIVQLDRFEVVADGLGFTVHPTVPLLTEDIKRHFCENYIKWYLMASRSVFNIVASSITTCKGTTDENPANMGAGLLVCQVWLMSHCVCAKAVQDFFRQLQFTGD